MNPIRFLIPAVLLSSGVAYAQPEPGVTEPDEPAPPAEGAPAPTAPAEPTAPVPIAPPPQAEDKPATEVRGASGFMDVRLNLTLTNENLFAEPGETIPSVPGWRFGRPNSLGTLFFDNYDTRFSGYETLSHAVLYRQVNQRNWEVEGALVLRVNDLAENRIDLSDAGSYIRVAWWRDPQRKELERFSLTAFPTSSDRMRLGYSYRLSWGGSPEYRRSRTSVPGIKVQYDLGKGYAFVGAKSAVILDRETAEEEAVMAFMGGAGYDVTDMVRVEVNGGVFDRGSNELQDVLTEQVYLYGASAQVAIHKDMPVLSSVDYKLYQNDPERVGRLFARTSYPGGLSWLVAAEATMLLQTLKDPEATGSTVTQRGLAGDINARVKWNRMRIRGDVQVRDLAFILHSTPSLPTFSDFPMDYEKTPNFFLAGGVDQNFGALTVGVIAGLDMPATLTTPAGIPGDTTATGEATAVVRNEGDITILPTGEEAAAQFAFKLTGQLDFNEFFASVLDVYYTYDPNQTRLTRDDTEDTLVREFGEFNQLGVNLTLQAKF
jgi:hypothetical protein